MLTSLKILLLFLPMASAFVAPTFASVWGRGLRARGLLALPSDVVLQMPVISMKPSIRTFLHFFLIGEMTEWRVRRSLQSQELLSPDLSMPLPRHVDKHVSRFSHTYCALRLTQARIKTS